MSKNVFVYENIILNKTENIACLQTGNSKHCSKKFSFPCLLYTFVISCFPFIALKRSKNRRKHDEAEVWPQFVFLFSFPYHHKTGGFLLVVSCRPRLESVVCWGWGRERVFCLWVYGKHRTYGGTHDLANQTLLAVVLGLAGTGEPCRGINSCTFQSFVTFTLKRYKRFRIFGLHFPRSPPHLPPFNG